MAKEVVKDVVIDASIKKTKDIKKIMDYPVLTTPGLVINEKLVCSGRVSLKAEVTTFSQQLWLKNKVRNNK